MKITLTLKDPAPGRWPHFQAGAAKTYDELAALAAKFRAQRRERWRIRETRTQIWAIANTGAVMVFAKKPGCRRNRYHGMAWHLRRTSRHQPAAIKAI